MNDQQEVDALVRVRDGLREASDAIDDLVGLLVSQNVAKDPTKLPFDIDRVPWVDKSNEKGPYQMCTDETNADFVALREFTLKHAGGAVTTKDKAGVSWYVWVFQDQKALGRKKSQFVKRRR